jgi:ELP3 family radical SAM enzyme/protein acetyltransferase
MDVRKSTDIEDIIKNARQLANNTNKPFGLTLDPKHELIMDAIYENFNTGLINNNDELKLFIKKAKHDIRPKYDLKNGHFNYYYDLGITNKKYKYNDKLKSILKCNLFRENSGVMVYSIFTSAYPKIKKEIIVDGAIEYIDEYVFNDKKFSCKYDCHYCPSEPGQPRSYLTKEPGVARATQNDHDPVKQFLARSKQYINQGHPIDKCEVIIQGGTWDSYPVNYREQFIRDIYYTANNLYSILSFEASLDEDISKMLNNFYKEYPPKTLLEEIKLNETALVRIIGLTPETRPDQINYDSIINLRKIGATRVQLGIQHINDKILKYVNRKCYYKDTIRAIKMLKDNGFKVDGHFMPDLPNPNNELDMVEEDKKMFDAINTDPYLKLDQIKIYPCMVVEHSRIEKWYQQGVYKPYGENIDRPIEYKKYTVLEKIEYRMKNPLYNLISDFCQNIHPSIRINRIIRDIPSDLVLGGTNNGCMRSEIELDLEVLNKKCKCIRCREVNNKSNKSIKNDDIRLNILPYEASGGLEFLLSFESDNGSNDYKDKVLHSFLRLRLSNSNEVIFPELVNTALIRELHTYGQVNSHQSNSDNTMSSQHKGYGKRLIKVAEYISYKFGYRRIAVISGVGVREYYRKLGYNDEGIGCYQIKVMDNNIIKLDNDLMLKDIKYIDRLSKLFRNREYSMIDKKIKNSIEYKIYPIYLIKNWLASLVVNIMSLLNYLYLKLHSVQ